MKSLINLLIRFWYLWTIVIILFIITKFRPRAKGYIGEKSVASCLARLNKSRYMVINNLMLQVGEKTSQIDHVIISDYGIFVIETKNYKGLIKGSEFDDYWKQILYKRTEKFYNPIKQNYGHIKAIKDVLCNYSEVNYFSVIVFTTDAELRVKTKTDVIYINKLIKTIKQYREETISDSFKERIYDRLISLNVNNGRNRKAHIKEINDCLEDEDYKILNNICPKCGGKLVLRNGKYGEFKGCSNFPKCRFTVK